MPPLHRLLIAVLIAASAVLVVLLVVGSPERTYPELVFPAAAFIGYHLADTFGRPGRAGALRALVGAALATVLLPALAALVLVAFMGQPEMLMAVPLYALHLVSSNPAAVIGWLAATAAVHLLALRLRSGATYSRK